LPLPFEWHRDVPSQNFMAQGIKMFKNRYLSYLSTAEAAAQSVTALSPKFSQPGAAS
jgi:hypothetical protein